jgi:N-acetyl-anhydromuramoyl-L-alanine amidase
MSTPAFSIDPQGWLHGNPATHGIALRHSPSPNADARPDRDGQRCPIELLVIHAISLPPGQFSGDAIERFFLNQLDPSAHPYFETIATMEVSAHFLVRRDGDIVQFVSTEARAWHAGKSCWMERERCNDFSIGIELEGSDDVPFEPAQYRSLNTLISALTQHYPIRSIAGHNDIAPGRKTDPGPHFEWAQLHEHAALTKRAGF